MLRSARHSGVALLAAFGIALFAGVRLPHADDPHYIDFAGPRPYNVWSNAAFLIAGVAGLFALVRARTRLVDPASESWALAIFFLGNIATCFGSAYFHAQPDLGPRLAWDRLPMTIAFAGFLAMHINERISMRTGTRLIIPLAVIGAATVWWWLATKDLSFYSAYQAFAAGGTLFLLLFFGPRYTGDRWYWAGVVLYGGGQGIRGVRPRDLRRDRHRRPSAQAPRRGSDDGDGGRAPSATRTRPSGRTCCRRPRPSTRRRSSAVTRSDSAWRTWPGAPPTRRPAD